MEEIVEMEKLVVFGNAIEHKAVCMVCYDIVRGTFVCIAED